jgi:hypothetical protein
MSGFNSTRFTAPNLMVSAQPAIRPFTGGYDMADAPLEDLYDIHDDYDDISVYVERAEGYRDE